VPEQVVMDQLKEWKCVQVNHHEDVGQVIEEWQKKGWRLHTNQATGSPTAVNHYLLFEKD
jgi:hypothetical protein